MRNLDDVSVEHSGSMLYTCNVLDLLPIRDLYSTSPNVGSFDTSSNFGMTGIIRRVPISSPFGFLILSNSTFEPADGRERGHQIIKTISFRICESSNKVIDLKKTEVSFSVILLSSG